MSIIKKIKFKNLSIFLIFVLGAFLRFYWLDKAPSGFYVDEAAIGYNSYSILQTGKDEFGKSWPIFFRSFGDYKLPVYIYSSIIPIKIFGLNVFAVRLASALSGALTTFLIYLLTKKMFPNKGNCFALFAGLIWAISPWSVLFSRAAFEAPLALLFFLAAFYLQLIAFEKKKIIILGFSILFYAVSVYTYHTERFLAPLFVFLSLLIYLKKEKYSLKSVKFVIIGLGLFLLLIFPQYFLFPEFAGQARINNLSILREGNFSNLPKRFLALYSAYFSPRNLFFEPESDLQRSLPELSVFYPWMIIFYFWGIATLIKEKTCFNKKIIILLLLISPLPAALTSDPFSSLRAFPLIFPLTIIISLGLDEFKKLIGKNFLGITFLIVLFISSVGLLVRSLFVLFPRERFFVWNGGYKELSDKLRDIPSEKILIDDPIGVSYIELLFFQKYPPLNYQQKNSQFDLNNYYRLKEWENIFSWDKIEVRPIVWEKDIYQHQLIVARPIAISESQAKEHFLIKAFAIIAPDGKNVFNGYFTNPEAKISNNLKKKNLNK